MFKTGEKIISFATKHYDRACASIAKAVHKTTWLALRLSFFEFLIIVFSDAGQSFIILKKREENSVSQLSYIQYKLYTKKLRLLPLGFFSTLAFIGLMIPYALNARSVVMNGGIHFEGYELMPAKADLPEIKEKKIYNRLSGNSEQPHTPEAKNDSLQLQLSDLEMSDVQGNAAVFSWKTNYPATTAIEYGRVDTEEVLRLGKEDVFETVHRISLDSLALQSRYRIRVYAKDAQGVLVESEFVEFTSSVDEQAPRVLELDAETLLVEKNKKIKVLISWKTNEPTKSIVYWDKGVTRGRELQYVHEVDEDYSLAHVSVLENFEKGILYQLRVAVADKAGNSGVSQDITFLTPSKENNILNLIWNTLTAP